MENQFILWNGDIAVMGKPSGNGVLIPECHILILSSDTYNLTQNNLLAVRLRKTRGIPSISAHPEDFVAKNFNPFLVNKDSIMFKIGSMDTKMVEEVKQKIAEGLPKAL